MRIANDIDVLTSMYIHPDEVDVRAQMTAVPHTGHVA